jgi:hypothetical protein
VGITVAGGISIVGMGSLSRGGGSDSTGDDLKRGETRRDETRDYCCKAGGQGAIPRAGGGVKGLYGEGRSRSRDWWLSDGWGRTR